MKRFTYEAIIAKEEDGYSVEFPQLTGAITSGKTRAEAIDNAAEVLSLIVGEHLDEGVPLPKPESLIQCINVSVEVTDEDVVSMKFLTLQETAEDLGVSPGRITQLITAGKLIDKYFDGVRKVSIESVNAYKATPRKAGRPRKNRTYELVYESPRKGSQMFSGNAVTLESIAANIIEGGFNDVAVKVRNRDNNNIVMEVHPDGSVDFFDDKDE